MKDDNYATMMIRQSLAVADKRSLSQFASYSGYNVVGKYHGYPSCPALCHLVLGVVARAVHLAREKKNSHTSKLADGFPELQRPYNSQGTP